LTRRHNRNRNEVIRNGKVFIPYHCDYDYDQMC